MLFFTYSSRKIPHPPALAFTWSLCISQWIILNTIKFSAEAIIYFPLNNISFPEINSYFQKKKHKI